MVIGAKGATLPDSHVRRTRARLWGVAVIAAVTACGGARAFVGVEFVPSGPIPEAQQARVPQKVREVRPGLGSRLAYPPPIDKGQIRICAWIHRWPDSVTDLALEGIEVVQGAVVREYSAEFKQVDQRLSAGLPQDRLDALRNRELLADRIVAREAQLVSEYLQARGVEEDAAHLATTSMTDHRRSVLGAAVVPVLGGGGDRDVRSILHGIAVSAPDPVERAQLAELAADILPDLGSLMRERLRIARRVVPESTRLFAELGETESGEARRQLLAERSALLKPLAVVERRIVEGSQAAMRRFAEAMQDDARRARIRAEVLCALHGPLGRDPWDPAPLEAVAKDLASDREGSRRSAEENRTGTEVDPWQSLADDVRTLAGAQSSDRELGHREALAAVTSFWRDFRERMTTSPDATERVMKELGAWHARSRARAEEVARRIEDFAASAEEGRREESCVRLLRAWRESAAALEAEQLRVFSFAQARLR